MQLDECFLDECFTFYGGGKREMGIVLGILLSLFVSLKGIIGIDVFYPSIRASGRQLHW